MRTAESRPSAATPRAVFVAALATLALLLVAALATQTARAADDVAAAEALVEKGEFGKAIEIYRRLAEAPGGAEDVRLQAGLGRALLAVGDPEGALGAVEIVARRRGSPEDHAVHAETLVLVAEQVITGGSRVRTVDVVPFLRDALAASSAARKGGEALAARLDFADGRAKRLLGDLTGARAALSSPSLAKDAEAQDLLARVCYEAGAFGDAATVWAAVGNARAAAAAWAAAKDPKAIGSYLALVTTTTNGDLASLVALLEEANAAAIFVGDAKGLDAGYAKVEATGDAKVAIARARGRLAEIDKRAGDAIAFYREVVAARPDEVEAWSDLGRARLDGAPQDPVAVAESMDLMTKVLSKAPDDAWARRCIEYQAAKDGEAAVRDWPDTMRLSRCVALYRALTKADPADATGWQQLGNAQRLSGVAKESIEAFDRAVAANAYDANAWNDRGLGLLAAGDEAKALASFEHAAGIDPGNPFPRQNAARLRWLAGDDAEAEAHLAAATRSARATGGHAMLYRFLLDRVWRSGQRPGLR